MTIDRRLLLTVFVVAMVLLAGCSGDGGGDGDDPATTDGAPVTTTLPDGAVPENYETVTPTGDAPTTTGGGETTNGGTTAAPTSGGTAVDPGDSGSVGYLAEHERSLRAQGGYAAEFSFEFDYPESSSESESGTASMSGEVRTNVNTGAQWQSVEIDAGEGNAITSEQYLPPGGDMVTVCMRGSGECAQTRNETIEAASASGFYNFTTPFVTELRPDDAEYFSDEGTEDTDNGERRRYVLDEISELPQEPSSYPGGTLTGVSYEILVDEETGLATDFTYEISYETDEGETATHSVDFSYTEFGDVSVEAPDWYGG